MYSYKVLSSVFLWIINYSIYEGGLQPGRPPCSAFLFESGKLLPIALQLALQKRLKKVEMCGIIDL